MCDLDKIRVQFCSAQMSPFVMGWMWWVAGTIVVSELPFSEISVLSGAFLMVFLSLAVLLQPLKWP